jgi:hypothetical protein
MLRGKGGQMKWIVKRYYVEIYEIEAKDREEAWSNICKQIEPKFVCKNLKMTFKKEKEDGKL